MSSITNNFRVSSAKNFLNSLTIGSNDSDDIRSILYLFIAKSLDWTGEPELFVDSVTENNTTKQEIYSLKRLNPSNCSLMIPKISWAEGNSYDIYNSYEDISNKNFYVVNSLNQVFKCLDNGSRDITDIPNVTGAALSNEPIKNPNDPITKISTPDGYIWKYVYTLSSEILAKFNTTGFIAVTEDDEIKEYNIETPGKIESIYYIHNKNEVVSPTNQFNSGVYYTDVKGDGTGAIVEIIVETLNSFNTITNVNIISNGTDYTYGYIDISDVYSDINLLNPIDFYPLNTTLNYDSTEYIKPIISPSFGHGYDNAQELFANKLLFSESLSFEVDSGNVPINADFTKYGIIKDPRDYSLSKITSETLYAADSILLDVVINLESGTLIQQNLDFNSDSNTSKSEIALGIVVNTETVTINGVNRTLLRYYGVSNKLSLDNRLVLKINKFIQSEPVYVGSLNNPYNILNYSGTVNNIIFENGVGNRVYNYYTGEILEIENINSIKRASDQTESIKFIIEF